MTDAACAQTELAAPSRAACVVRERQELHDPASVLSRTLVCDRHQGFRRDNKEYIVYCFSERSDAEYFHMHFPNGEFVKPEERPSWRGSSKTRR